MDAAMSDIQSVLWDIPEEKVVTLSAEFLIMRALSYGTVPLMLHMKRRYGLDAVRNVFRSLKQTSMSARRYAYAKNVLLA
jgi:hypothetical protein